MKLAIIVNVLVSIFLVAIIAFQSNSIIKLKDEVNRARTDERLLIEKQAWLDSEKRNLSESLDRMGIELVFTEKGYTLTKHFK